MLITARNGLKSGTAANQNQIRSAAMIAADNPLRAYLADGSARSRGKPVNPPVATPDAAPESD
jgi:hypothetical protein